MWGANLIGANLTGAVFQADPRLANTTFSCAILDDAVFHGVDLTGANFKGARWDPARSPQFVGGEGQPIVR